MTNVAEVHIQPTLVEMYTKHTETDITLEHEIFVRDVRDHKLRRLKSETHAIDGVSHVFLL